MNLNKVTLIGYLATDPKSRTLPSGQKVAAITVITAEDMNPRATDQEILTAVPHDVVAYGRLGEIILKYLKIGDRVYIEGRLRKTRSGKKNAPPNTEIVATQLIMLGSRSQVRQPGETKE